LIDLEHCEFVRLHDQSDTSSFDCDDTDLNEFLLKDAKNYLKELLAVTYLLIHKDEIAGFFSLSNDALLDNGDRTIWNRLCRRIPNPKRKKIYPAVKVGRLGVHIKYQHGGFGTELMLFLKGWFTKNNKTGCRFILVDAYNKEKVLSYYRKNGFEFLLEKDKKDRTRVMYYDLKKFSIHSD
jgi:GNAT superfamily N-acetyltransferase